jgi:Zn-dependent metalloprotease
MPRKGLRSYGFHVDERPDAAASVRSSVRLATEANTLVGDEPRAPESTARDYLYEVFANESLSEITSPDINGDSSTFELLATDYSEITHNTIVRFDQRLSGVRIHGSSVTVELDRNNELVAVNSAFGEPHGIGPTPTISPEDAQVIVQRYANPPAGFQLPEPELIYYLQTEEEKWHLAFIMPDVASSATDSEEAPPLIADYVVDAQSGNIIAVLARICGANGLDALNQPRQFETSFDVVTAGQELRNTTLNIVTRDFTFQDIGTSTANLPGRNIVAPPLPWSPAAISAHANAEVVARFFGEILNRRGPDGRGGPFVSSINCVCVQLGSQGQEWLNSFWINHQVIYGQRRNGAGFRSFAAALDLVAHEFFHGVTEANPPRLVYQNETGALNESYSDIFGVLMANGLNPNWSAWQWQIGAATGRPLRNLSDPTSLDQPDHMNNFQRLPANNDFGGVHVNSGIHNKAAFNIMTARDAQNNFLFSPRFIAQLFYSALAHLGATSLFSDSRRAVEISAMTLLRTDPQKEQRLAAISQGFAAVGIS